MRAYERSQADYFSLQTSGTGRSDIAIFSQDWWLNIVRGSSDYHELKVISGGDVVGRLPLVLSRGRFGIVRGQDPHWSHLGGPIIDEKLNRNEQARVIRGLIDQLPRQPSFDFVCDPTLSYSELVRDAFIDAGFAHTTQVTYLRHPGEGDVLNTRKSKHRGHFKRAAKSLECVDISAADFVRFFEMNLKARGRRSYAPLDILRSLTEEALARGCARAIAAKPLAHNGFRDRGLSMSTPFDAAIVYVWDSSRCYYWLSTHRVPAGESSRAKPHPDAIKLLALRAIEDAQAMGLIFDADGVATPGADHLYRNLLGLRQEQRRDVFARVNIVDRLYKKCRERFRMIASHKNQHVAASERAIR